MDSKRRYQITCNKCNFKKITLTKHDAEDISLAHESSKARHVCEILKDDDEPCDHTRRSCEEIGCIRTRDEA